jgi:hypothetical protein
MPLLTLELKPPMTTPTPVPLQSLAERIAQQQSELEDLRREYDARQAHLAELKRRRDELRGQLRQLQTEIKAVNQGESLPPVPGPAKATRAMRRGRGRRGKRGHPQRLVDLIVEVMRGATGPVTVKQLAEEVVRRKFPTTSKNIPPMVRTRLQELVSDGICRHAQDRPGFVLTNPNSVPEAMTFRAAAGIKRRKRGGRRRKAARQAGSNGRQKRSLQSILGDLLARSRQPVPARDLAEQAKAEGYETRSENFTNVVWVMLGKMENVENVPGEGYRLRRR